MCNSKYSVVKKRPNGALMVWHKGVLRECDTKRLVNGEIKACHIYEAKFKVQGEWVINTSTDRKVAERWLNDMRKKYKLQIIGTMLKEKYLKLTKEVEDCIRYTNYMLPRPIEGAFAPDKNGDMEIVNFLGVNDGTIYYKTQDGKECECHYFSMFETFELGALCYLCDEISKHK